MLSFLLSLSSKLPVKIMVVCVLLVGFTCFFGIDARAGTANIASIVQKMDLNHAEVVQLAKANSLNMFALRQMGYHQTAISEQDAQRHGYNLLLVGQKGEENYFIGEQRASKGSLNLGLAFQVGQANTTVFNQDASHGQVNLGFSFQYGIGNIRYVIQPKKSP